MLEVQRHQGIIKQIKQNGAVRVSNLSKLFGVSQNTIRRDLQKLEEEGLVKRTHGGAILENFYGIDLPFIAREDTYQEEKQRIGKRAAEIIQDGESIILDAGTTVAQVARNIKNKHNLTVITNAVNVALELADCREILTILTGGIIRGVTNCLVGYQAEEFLSEVHVDRLFLAAGGISVEEGLTNPNPFEVPVKKAMIKASEEVILLVAHNKIGNVSLTPITSIDAVHRMITDDGASREEIELFQKRGIEVILV